MMTEKEMLMQLLKFFSMHDEGLCFKYIEQTSISDVSKELEDNLIRFMEANDIKI